jgi:hypothetical protein
MSSKRSLIKDPSDRGMAEIEDLYSELLIHPREDDISKLDIHPEIKSRLHQRILRDIEALRLAQKQMTFGSPEYRDIDFRIRRRLLKEIQIIIDAYVIALQERRVQEWEYMYGDIEHYKREFFYFRMDRDYESLQKALEDYKFIEE